ncbi:hypothetical protein EDC48_101177 [Gibbsiella quercinecans]|nr:hypothetical protein EDC48_101177 [Gibbsiella quercinecans]
MKTSRFTDSQIIAILKQSEAELPCLNCAGNMASVAPVFTSGD